MAIALAYVSTGLWERQATEYAKYSMVYLHCGNWAKAEELQLQVKDYVFAMLGPEFEYGIAIALLLSMNYVLQTRSNQARELQKQVLESTKKYFGPDHRKTLQTMDTFGATCLMCSRLQEANQLHQEVIDKLSKMEGFGPEHENTLTAIDNLAKVKLHYFDFKSSLKLQLQAYEGMRKIWIPDTRKL